MSSEGIITGNPQEQVLFPSGTSEFHEPQNGYVSDASPELGTDNEQHYAPVSATPAPEEQVSTTQPTADCDLPNESPNQNPDFIPPRFRIRCAACKKFLKSYPEYIDHCAQLHRFTYKFFNESFQNYGAYNTFRRALRERHNTNLTTLPGVQKFESGISVFNLRCERSGRARKEKTRKCGNYCTAYLTVIRYPDGRIDVRGVLDHFGHDPGFRGCYTADGAPMAEDDLDAAPVDTMKVDDVLTAQELANLQDVSSGQLTEASAGSEQEPESSSARECPSSRMKGSSSSETVAAMATAHMTAEQTRRHIDNVRNGLMALVQELSTFATQATNEQILQQDKALRQLLSVWEYVRNNYHPVHVPTSQAFPSTSNTIFPGSGNTSAFSNVMPLPQLQAIQAHAHQAYYQLQHYLPPMPPYGYNPY